MTKQIDPRGQQFAAALTSVVLVAALLTLPGPVGFALVGVQALLFAVAVVRGVHRTPVAAVFRAAVRPRIGAPAHLEDAAPPRFAQGVGLVFTLLALVAFATGAQVLGFVAIAFALVAALLNATIGLCLGCEVYLLGRRLAAAGSPPDTSKFTATGSRSTT